MLEGGVVQVQVQSEEQQRKEMAGVIAEMAVVESQMMKGRQSAFSLDRIVGFEGLHARNNVYWNEKNGWIAYTH